MEANKIQELVLSFMKTLGINCNENQPGIWKAEIPASERTFFNGYEEYSFSFNREIAEKHRDIELVCDGSYLLKKITERLSSVPKVTRLFAKSQPEVSGTPGKPGELLLIAPGKYRYRQKISFHFKVSYICNHRNDNLFTVLVDPASNDVYLKENVEEFDLENYSENPDPGIPVEGTGEEILKLYLKACRRLEDEVAKKLDGMRTWVNAQFEIEKEKVREYIDEQKAELTRKKANVCFHLYFFQKEEEIEKMIADLESEKVRKIQELQEKYSMKIEISLINAVVLCIPTIGLPASMVPKKRSETTLKSSFARIHASDDLQVRPAV
ncbi:MAG: hypothetical protein HQM10_01265 [Candidatus Riflebacteria bacterium]|nr:hypothetical protein [Candidatus Riflebacteria bacterium]